MRFPPADFKSAAYANSATPAQLGATSCLPSQYNRVLREFKPIKKFSFSIRNAVTCVYLLQGFESMKTPKYTDEQFIEAVSGCKTIKGTLEKLGLQMSGGNYYSFYKTLRRLNVTIDHFDGWSGKCPAAPFVKSKLDDILIKNSSYSSTHHLKHRLYKENLLKEECSICGIKNWQGALLSLHLDHINGEHTDNRIENLRILCPNCHSQTSTFSGKKLIGKYFTNRCKSCNKLIKAARVRCKDCLDAQKYKGTAKPIKAPVKTCIDCGKEFQSINDRCIGCIGRNCPTKISWPSKEELEKLVWKQPSSTLGKLLGVSDVAIKKHCKKLGISKPPRGYWTKKKADEIKLA